MLFLPQLQLWDTAGQERFRSLTTAFFRWRSVFEGDQYLKMISMMFTFQGCHGLPSCLWCHQWPKSSRYKVLGFEAFQSFTSDWTEGWISRYTSPHASTNKNLLSRDWLDQLTTHAYTAAPDIVLCGNKVLLTRHHYEWNECFTKKLLFNQVDLEGLRTVSSDRGRSMAAELGLPYFETSAATGQGWFKSSP